MCIRDSVYTAPLDGKTTLENIYRTFNTDDRPADFRGHSLSVSDVVAVSYTHLDVYKRQQYSLDERRYD